MLRRAAYALRAGPQLSCGAGATLLLPAGSTHPARSGGLDGIIGPAIAQAIVPARPAAGGGQRVCDARQGDARAAAASLQHKGGQAGVGRTLAAHMQVGAVCEPAGGGTSGLSSGGSGGVELVPQAAQHIRAARSRGGCARSRHLQLVPLMGTL
jgi:hypothetical protein